MIDVQRRDDYRSTSRRRLDAAQESRLIFTTSPNNPTRHADLAVAKSRRCLRPARPVIVDEAYTEFAGESCVELVREHANLIVLRTLSKWAGLAGLRLGYMIADPALIDLVLRDQAAV